MKKFDYHKFPPLALAMLGCGYALADDCTKSLLQDVTTVQESSATRFAMSSLMDNSLSSTERSQIGVTVPVYGVPVSLNDEQAKTSTSKFFQQTGINWDQKTAVGIVSQTLSQKAVEAYRICVSGQHKSGPRAIAYDATKDAVEVKVSWIAPPGAATTAQATYEVTGAEVRTYQKAWTNNESAVFILKRIKGQDIRFTVNIGKESDTAFIPYIPIITVSENRVPGRYPNVGDPSVDPNGNFRMANDGSGRNQGPISDCRSAPAGSVFDATVTALVVDLKVGNLDSTTYAHLTKNDARQICYQAYLRPLAAEGGGDFRFHVLYTLVSSSYAVSPP